MRMPAKSTIPPGTLEGIREELRRNDELERMESKVPKYTLVTSKTLLRNNCPGDYYETPDGDWNILAVQMKNPHHSEPILIHETIEAMLIRAAGIPEPVVDAFDAYFEVLRKFGVVGEDDEPGDHPSAPYFKQHQLCAHIERIVCEEGFGLSWDEYEDASIKIINEKAK